MSSEKQKHGVFGGFIKVLMVIIFTAIGLALIIGNAYLLAAKSSDFGKYLWLPIVNLVFGCILLTSPFFLSHRREGLNTVFRFLIAFIFVIIGACLITVGACSIAMNWGTEDILWVKICNLVFGCLLFTSPIFLKKDL